MMKRSLSICMLLAGFAALLQGQRLDRDSIVFRPEVERQFVQAMRYFGAANYDSAAAAFVASIRDFPRGHRASASYVMGAKALYQIRNYRESVRMLKDLLDLYPESQYADDAHYGLGLAFMKQERFEDAASEFLTTRQSTRDTVLARRSLLLLDQLCGERLTIGQLQILSSDATTLEMKGLINYRIGERFYRAGDGPASLDVLRSVAGLPAKIHWAGDAQALIDRIVKGGIAKIGVVLPLMLKSKEPGGRDQGLEFLTGMQMAVDEYNLTAVVRAIIDARDTERDPGAAARQVTELCTDPKLLAVIGPLSSQEVFACAGIANARGIPLITPTATANGIASIGPFVFQANPDYEMRGRTMAEFAFTQLHARRSGILAPRDAVGKFMAESFADEFRSLGGEVLDLQWYESGAGDLRAQFSALRQRGLQAMESPSVDFGGKFRNADMNRMMKWGISQRTIDSLVEAKAIVRLDVLFGPNGRTIADSLKIPYQAVKVRFDSLGLPVTSMDVLFAPIASSDEIAVVSTQAKFFNLKAQLLGTQDWLEVNDLDEHRQYTDGILFSTDLFISDTSAATRLFAARFQKLNKNRPPTPSVIMGFDIMRLILQQVSAGATTRNELTAALSGVKGYRGIHSTVSFAERRVNTFMNILQFKGRELRWFGEVDLTRRLSR